MSHGLGSFFHFPSGGKIGLGSSRGSYGLRMLVDRVSISSGRCVVTVHSVPHGRAKSRFDQPYERLLLLMDMAGRVGTGESEPGRTLNLETQRET